MDRFEFTLNRLRKPGLIVDLEDIIDDLRDEYANVSGECKELHSQLYSYEMEYNELAERDTLRENLEGEIDTLKSDLGRKEDDHREKYDKLNKSYERLMEVREEEREKVKEIDEIYAKLVAPSYMFVTPRARKQMAKFKKVVVEMKNKIDEYMAVEPKFDYQVQRPNPGDSLMQDANEFLNRTAPLVDRWAKVDVDGKDIQTETKERLLDEFKSFQAKMNERYLYVKSDILLTSIKEERKLKKLSRKREKNIIEKELRRQKKRNSVKEAEMEVKDLRLEKENKELLGIIEKLQAALAVHLRLKSDESKKKSEGELDMKKVGKYMEGVFQRVVNEFRDHQSGLIHSMWMNIREEISKRPIDNEVPKGNGCVYLSNTESLNDGINCWKTGDFKMQVRKYLQRRGVAKVKCCEFHEVMLKEIWGLKIMRIDDMERYHKVFTCKI